MRSLHSLSNHAPNGTTNPTASSGYRTIRRLLLTLVAISMVAASCGSGHSSGGEYSFDHECADVEPIRVHAVDVSGTSQSEAILENRLDAITTDLAKAADCASEVIVFAYTNSPAAHTIVYSDTLEPRGATEIARDKKSEQLVIDERQDIATGLNDALAELPADGSDLAAAFVVASDIASSSPEIPHEITIHTDGVSNVGDFITDTPDLDITHIEAALKTADIGALDGQSVHIIGVGRIANGPQPPTDFVTALRAAATAMCEATAATCHVTTA